MKKKAFSAFLAVVALVGATVLFLPSPVAQAAANCVFCPQIVIDCGPCANLIPQTCKRCQYCKPIPGCHSE